jgi:hypothetical protein
MSILPAQFTPSSGTTDHSSEKEPPAKAAPKAASQIAEPVPTNDARHPAEALGPKVSTDLRIDGKHRVYYQVVNDHTGDVVCEIPSEQIRELEEGSSAPSSSGGAGRRIDVKL